MSRARHTGESATAHASPTVRSATRARVCIHGTGDQFVPIEQSRSYVAAATAAGGTAELVEVEGDHFVVIDPDSEAWSTTLAHLDTLA